VPRIERAGLRLIIGYKIAKGLIELLLALTVITVGQRGLSAVLGGLARELERYLPSVGSLALANSVGADGGHRTYLITLVALGADGFVTLGEALLLYYGYWWAPWLVAFITAAFLPWEAARLAHHPALGRLGLLVVNFLIFSYLIWVAFREGRRDLSRV
jgi:uncharacterized membrane protein (DUF2068 family)